jgi:hypothetical protein
MKFRENPSTGGFLRCVNSLLYKELAVLVFVG